MITLTCTCDLKWPFSSLHILSQSVNLFNFFFLIPKLIPVVIPVVISCVEPYWMHFKRGWPVLQSFSLKIELNQPKFNTWYGTEFCELAIENWSNINAVRAKNKALALILNLFSDLNFYPQYCLKTRYKVRDMYINFIKIIFHICLYFEVIYR